jgi:hypothetical protein
VGFDHGWWNLGTHYPIKTHTSLLFHFYFLGNKIEKVESNQSNSFEFLPTHNPLVLYIRKGSGNFQEGFAS